LRSMDVRGEVFDPGLFSIPGRLQNLKHSK